MLGSGRSIQRSLPFCYTTITTPKPNPRYPRELITWGDHVKKKRLDLGLNQTEAAKLVGVGIESIINWERNHTAPQVRYLPCIIAFLGYVPYNPTLPLTKKLIIWRTSWGLSQKAMAERLGVVTSTVTEWEGGKRTPSAKRVSQILLTLSTMEFE